MNSEIYHCSKAVLLLWIIFVIYVLCLPCVFVFSMQPCGHLLRKDWPLGPLVFEVFLCFVTFPCGVVSQVELAEAVVIASHLCCILIFSNFWNVYMSTCTCTLSLLGNFASLFSKSTFKKNSFTNTIRPM